MRVNRDMSRGFSAAVMLSLLGTAVAETRGAAAAPEAATTDAIEEPAGRMLTPEEIPLRADQRLPEDLEGVGVTEHLGEDLPLSTPFVDDRGREISLGQYFAGDRPVLVTLNYSDCPMLCSLHLNGLTDAMREMDLSIGEDFDVVTVSVDPLETHQQAQLTKQRYLRDYGRRGAESGWHFLTGREADIHAVASALGFRYRLVKETGEYAHSAVTFVVTPDGEISRYLYGVLYDAKTLGLSLVEASEGRIGSTLDRVLLFCFHYDATKGRYGPAAERLMRAGGFMTVLMVGLAMARLWRKDRTREAA